jgi:hypothetical protein
MGKLPTTEHRVLNGPSGALQAILERPTEGASVGDAVVCHPHPLHGGTMQNKVAHTLSRAFTNCGFQALRFNFRGVGESEGTFDNGAGEQQDVLAAATWLQERSADLPLWLAGFSFGAAMAVHAAAASTPAGLISIAPATTRFAGSLAQQPRCPWLIIQGDQDELVPVDETVDWVNSLEPGPELSIFSDTEHFFHGKLVMLRNAVEEFVRKHH